MLSFEFLLPLSAILKLDFLKSPGKSGSARPPRGMKLGNSDVARFTSNVQTCLATIQVVAGREKLLKKVES